MEGRGSDEAFGGGFRGRPASRMCGMGCPCVWASGGDRMCCAGMRVCRPISHGAAPTGMRGVLQVGPQAQHQRASWEYAPRHALSPSPCQAKLQTGQAHGARACSPPCPDPTGSAGHDRAAAEVLTVEVSRMNRQQGRGQWRRHSGSTLGMTFPKPCMRSVMPCHARVRPPLLRMLDSHPSCGVAGVTPWVPPHGTNSSAPLHPTPCTAFRHPHLDHAGQQLPQQRIVRLVLVRGPGDVNRHGHQFEAVFERGGQATHERERVMELGRGRHVGWWPWTGERERGIRTRKDGACGAHLD